MDSSELIRRAGLVKMLLLDVDGVLTDGKIILSGSTDEAKQFNVQDGMGVTLARAAGIQVGILTGRSSEAVKKRAQELRLDAVIQGSTHKSEGLKQLQNEYGLTLEEIAYIGDDVPDLPVLRKIGLPIAVANACAEVKASSVHITSLSGGEGAVREAIDWLLSLRGQKEKIYEQFANQ